MKTIWRMAGRTTATIFVALLVGALSGVGCGGSLVDSQPGNGTGSGDKSLTLIASTATQTNVTHPVMRANGRDTLLLEATVQGLSQDVGFYIPTTFGTITGGTPGADGYTYFTADRNGIAKATLVSAAGVGDTEVIAKSKDVTVSIPITFQFATLTLSPATMTFNTAGSRETITATGGTPPVSFTSSDSEAVYLYPRSDVSVLAQTHSMSALVKAGTVTIYAIDAEGQQATAVITSTPSCSAAVLTVAPATGVDGSVTSIAVTDADRAGHGSISVTAAYPLAVNNATVTLLENSLSPGFFQSNYTIACGGGCIAADIVTFKYSDIGVDCYTPTTITANFTIK